MSRQPWTKRCRAGMCGGLYRNPSFIPDDAPYGVCTSCLTIVLDLSPSGVCNCCGAGTDAVTEESVFRAVARIERGEPVVPRYVVCMWYDGTPFPMKGEEPGKQRIGIFDTEDDPVNREPVVEVKVRAGTSWTTPYHRLKRKAAAMSAVAAKGGE